MAESAAHVRVIEETPAYWRVLFDYPPFNIVDTTQVRQVQFPEAGALVLSASVPSRRDGG